MNLDRNIEGNKGRGKYALLKLRRLRELQPGLTEEGQIRLAEAFDLLESAGILDWGDTPETEFFLIRLKDQYASAALSAYAAVAHADDPEYSDDVYALAKRAGVNHPMCKKPY